MAQIGIESITPRVLDNIGYSNQGRNLKTGWVFCDFLGAWHPWDGYWDTSTAGTATDAYPIAAIADRVGVMRIYAGTDAAGRASIAMNGLAVTGVEHGLLFGGGQYTFETELRPNALAAGGGDLYFAWAGFGDNVAAGDMVDGAYFYYNGGVAANWQCVTANNSTRTTTDSGIAVSPAYAKLKIIVNATGTAVQFFINGVLVATNVANIPTARQTASIIKIEKSAGAINHSLLIDWTWFHYDLTTSR